MARLSMWHGQGTKLRSQKIAAACGIISTMQAGLRSRSSTCHGLFNLTVGGHPHTAKLRSTSFLAWLLANGQVLIKVLSSFLLLILLDGKRGRNRGVFGKKASSKAALLILPLHNSFEDALLLLPLHLLIVLSSLRLPAAKSGVGVFGKNNAGKRRGDDPRSMGADGRTRANDLGIRIDKDVGADDSGTAADNSCIATDDPGTAADDLGTATDNLGTAADDPGTKTDADAEADNLGTVADDPGIGTDTDAGTDDPGIAASNKARARAASFFALRHALFLLASSSESVTAFSSPSLPSSSSTILRSKPVLSCSVTSVKRGAPSSRYPVDKIWRSSLSKVLSRMSAVVRFL